MKLQNTTITTINQMIVAIGVFMDTIPDDRSVANLPKVDRYKDEAIVAAHQLVTATDVTLDEITNVITKCNEAAQVTVQQFGNSSNITVGSIGSLIVADYASIVMMLKVEMNRPDVISSRNLQQYES